MLVRILLPVEVFGIRITWTPKVCRRIAFYRCWSFRLPTFGLSVGFRAWDLHLCVGCRVCSLRIYRARRAWQAFASALLMVAMTVALDIIAGVVLVIPECWICDSTVCLSVYRA